MLDLDPASIAIVKTILEKHLANAEVKAFGSRVTGSAKEFSDLDLAIIAEEKIPIEELNELRFDFSNSNLPIMVDVVDWYAISEEFRHVISKESESLFQLGS